MREFWSQRGLANLFLLPLASAYWLGWQARKLRHSLGGDSKLSVPVVIAGGITAGGGGKTLLAQALVTGLRERGKVPGVIARGYGSDETAPRMVSADSDPRKVGDEPALLAAKLEVATAVGVDRLAAARLLLQRHPEVQVIVSDDGLQHLALPRQFEIVALSGYGLGNGWLLPAGPLREPAARLSVVDAVVRKGGAQGKNEHSLALGEAQLLDSSGNAVARAELAGKRVCALAGIAQPQEFFDDVATAGIELDKCLPMPDHHRYRLEELRAIEADCLIMTPKDAIKCKRLDDRRLIEFYRQPSIEDSLLDKVIESVNAFQPA